MRDRYYRLLAAVAFSLLVVAPLLWVSGMGFTSLLDSIIEKVEAQVQVQLAPTPAIFVQCANNNAAINNAVTLTIAGLSGQSIYITEFDAQSSNDATGTGPAQANTKYTSTNLSSTAANLWSSQFSLALTANIFSQVGPFHFAPPMKSAQQGTAVTFVSPAANAHATFNLNACYYYAP